MKMNKVVLAAITLDYKDRFDSTLSAITYELKELKTSFCKLGSDLAVSWNVNGKVTKQVILVEKKCWAKKQYSRRECLEILGTPESIQDYDLEGCVLKHFNECDSPGDLGNIEACYRLEWKASSKKVIIKLSKRKDMLNVLRRKKKLKPVDITKVRLPQGSLVFINQSLCCCYRCLCSLFKR